MNITFKEARTLCGKVMTNCEGIYADEKEVGCIYYQAGLNPNRPYGVIVKKEDLGSYETLAHAQFSAIEFLNGRL